MLEAPLDEVLDALPGGIPLPVACWLVARVASAASEQPCTFIAPSTVLIREDGTVRVDVRGREPSFAYRAPEALGGKVVAPSALVFGLGGLLVECLTSRHPFARSSAMETRIAVREEQIPPVLGRVALASRGLDELIAKATAKNPEERFASAAALADALNGYLDDELHEVGPDTLVAVVRAAATGGDARAAAHDPVAVLGAPLESTSPKPPKPSESSRPADSLRAPASVPPERVTAHPSSDVDPLPEPREISLPPNAPPPSAELFESTEFAVRESEAEGFDEPSLAPLPLPAARISTVPPAAPASEDFELHLSSQPPPEPVQGLPSLDLEPSPPPPPPPPRPDPPRAPSPEPAVGFMAQEDLRLDEAALQRPAERFHTGAVNLEEGPPSFQREGTDREDDDVGTAWVTPLGIFLGALLALAILYQFVLRPMLR